MLFKSNKKLEAHMKKLLYKGLDEKGVFISSSDSTEGVVLMRLSNSPLSYMYGWDLDKDYWIFSEN